MREIEELRVGDVMTHGIIGVDVDDSVQNAAEVMKRNHISALLVLDEGDGAGIITERDIIVKIVAEGGDARKTRTGDIMTCPLITVSPDLSIDDAARLMRDKDIRRLVVTNKDKIVGILSEFDIVRVEPELHMLISEQSKWHISEADVDAFGSISGMCDECENYSESLHSLDGRMLCDECD